MGVLEPVRPVFRAAAEVLLPAAARLDDVGWQRLEQIVENALAQRPARMQRQFQLFLRILDLSTLPRHRRRFRALPRDAREGALRRMERGRRLILRRGVWGLRTLVYMGYYTQPVHTSGIGYRATPRGWKARQ